MLTANLLILFVALPALVSTLADANLPSASFSRSIYSQMATGATPPASDQFHRGSGRCTTTCS
ncbi:hypothetical protein [Leptolyngbya sp. O-77]|uniref:hypothetical protein n=1 Tax=Leptolyngbya sp. O-77 TaxID=1080068 RepID=UPI00074D32F1|nr:hypothetical protein [Leptolyngbya sp. O-77]BAU42361.1 hypothetical protein O77CONTIG1_02182 [Leptolyngbya sp. O-77]